MVGNNAAAACMLMCEGGRSTKVAIVYASTGYMLKCEAIPCGVRQLESSLLAHCLAWPPAHLPAQCV